MARTQDPGPGYLWGDITEPAVRLGKAIAGMPEASPHPRSRVRHGGSPPGLGVFAGQGPWGRGGPAGKGPGTGHHDVRTAVLTLLAEEPRSGREIIQEIDRRSGGAWRPGPRVVYPALRHLTDEGLILGRERDGRRIFRLTDAGHAHALARPDPAGAGWETMAAEIGREIADLFEEAAQVGTALLEVADAGSRSQIAEARLAMAETRRRLYDVLAERGRAHGT
jgi:DNA-binding PadR family transcriptional regulator